MSISLIIITKNEENNIAACLQSVKGVADEIVLVDGCSTDRTVEIAKTYGAKTFTREFDSFTAQKGFALANATQKWVLNLDADEALSPQLKEEILAATREGKFNAFYLTLQNIFLGRAMRYSGLGKLHKLRLCLREGASYQGGKVHETLTPRDANISTLTAPLWHTPYRDIYHYFEKFNNYTTLGAQTLAEKGKKFNPLQLLRPGLDFFKIYFIRLGFMDGMQGLIWAALSSFYPLVKYLKLWEINRK